MSRPHGHKARHQALHELTSAGAAQSEYRLAVDLKDRLASTKVRFIVGKGGVGKSTVTAALALAGAASGLLVDIVELDGRDDAARHFDYPDSLGATPVELYRDDSGGSVRASRIEPDEALIEWLRQHGMGRLVRRLTHSGALDVISTAIPGIRDVLILGKLKAIARDSDADVVLVDAPATGHSLSLLASPSALVRATRGGPIRRQAEEVDELLRDESRCCVSLVALPSELAVTEAIEAAFDIEERAGVALAEVILNQFEGDQAMLRSNLSDAEAKSLDADLAQSVEVARWFSLAVADEQRAQRDRLRRELPLGQVTLRRIDADVITLNALSDLATSLLERQPT